MFSSQLLYFAGDLPVALRMSKKMSSINVFIVPKRSGLYYIENELNLTREVTFPITLPNNVSKLSFFYCETPTANTEFSTFYIGMKFCSVKYFSNSITYSHSAKHYCYIISK